MPVRPGDRLRIKAADYNDMLAAAAAYKTEGPSLRQGSRGAGDSGLPPGWVWLKNNTATDRARFEILGLGDPLFTQADDAAEFYNRIAFKGETPAFSDHFGKFVVLQEPIAAGRIGLAMISGVSNVILEVQDDDHEFADLKNGAPGVLRTYTGGSARILWKAGSSGDQWGRVILGACHVKLWQFQLNYAFGGSPAVAPLADLIGLDGLDTAQDVAIIDPLDIFSSNLGVGDYGYCVQQGGLFYAIQAPCP